MTDAPRAVARGPARLASASIGIVTIVTVIEGALLLLRAARIGDADYLGSAYSLAVTGNGLPDALALTIGVASLSALAGWLAWQYRAASILVARGMPPKHTPQWAVLWWFVPFADLWMPGVTTAELWRGARQGAGRTGRAWSVWVWWLVFAAGWIIHSLGIGLRQAVLGDVYSGRGLSTFTPRDVVDIVLVSNVIAGVGAAILVAAAPLALYVIRRITAALSSPVSLVAPPRPDV